MRWSACFFVLSIAHALFSLSVSRWGPALAQMDPAEIRAEFEQYLRQAQTLKQNIDQGGYDRRRMLKVLRSAGVLEKLPSAASGGQRTFPTEFRPFQIRSYQGLWRWPLRAGIVSSEFGWRMRRGRMHEGIDVAAHRGSPVLASAAGVVLYSGNRLSGYGNLVIVRHDQNTVTLYAHNDRILVHKGEPVKAGQIIATLGSTGRSTGPHIHFEIRRYGHAINPRTYLVRSRF